MQNSNTTRKSALCTIPVFLVTTLMSGGTLFAAEPTTLNQATPTNVRTMTLEEATALREGAVSDTRNPAGSSYYHEGVEVDRTIYDDFGGPRTLQPVGWVTLQDVRDNFGQSDGGDVNGDGITNIDDLNEVRNNGPRTVQPAIPAIYSGRGDDEGVTPEPLLQYEPTIEDIYKNFGQGGGGDYDGDGDTDIDDLNAFRNHNDGRIRRVRIPHHHDYDEPYLTSSIEFHEVEEQAVKGNRRS